MALQTYTCTRCDQEFKAPNFKCSVGGRHAVPSKTYYAPVANLNLYVSEERLEMMETGKNRITPARMITFIRGTYTTTDSEDQYSLETEENGLITATQWQEVFIDKEERIKMKEREADRKINEANEILARAKAQVAEIQKDGDLVGAAKAKVK